MGKKSKKSKSAIRIPEILRSPLRDESEAVVSSDAEHALFLRCFELYRVIELADRTLESMIEAYSKYRTRDLFKETLQMRYFDFDSAGLDGIDPGLNANVIAMFNRIYELRLSLLFEDGLPFTVKARVEAVLSELKREWNSIQAEVETRYQWSFKLL
ncbi:MAG: hypothetical protein ACJ763_15060 [Bdellovibrionia bacterium]